MVKNTYPGKFIVFEGPDGSGQSTQADLLKKHFEEKGKTVCLTHEPTLDSPAGLRVKNILTHQEPPPSPFEFQKLYAIDREVHLKNKIIPALKKGEYVISDRYFFSTFAFGSLGCDLEALIDLNKNFLYPDLTFILRVAPEISIYRIEKRGRQVEFFEKLEKLKRVNNAYKILQKRFENCFLIDGEKPIEEVHAVVLAKLNILNIGLPAYNQS